MRDKSPVCCSFFINLFIFSWFICMSCGMFCHSFNVLNAPKWWTSFSPLFEGSVKVNKEWQSYQEKEMWKWELPLLFVICCVYKKKERRRMTIHTKGNQGPPRKEGLFLSPLKEWGNQFSHPFLSRGQGPLFSAFFTLRGVAIAN